MNKEELREIINARKGVPFAPIEVELIARELKLAKCNKHMINEYWVAYANGANGLEDSATWKGYWLSPDSYAID